MEELDTGLRVSPHDDGRSKPRLMSAEPLWGVPEVAGYFDVSEETVRKWARSGELPGKKVGRLWRFHPEIIQEWMRK